MLADIDHTNRLSLQEFAIAMHLIMRVRLHNAPIPDSLPPSILKFALAEMSKPPSPSTIDYEIESHNDSLRNSVDLENLKAEIEMAQEKSNFYNNQGVAMQQVNEDLSRDVSEWKSQLEELNSVVDSSIRDIELLKQEEQSLAQEVYKYQHACKTVESKLIALNEEKDAIKLQTDRALQMSKQSEELHGELVESVEQVQLELTQAQSRLTQLLELRNNQQSIVSNRKENSQKLLASKNAVMEQISGLNKELASLKNINQMYPSSLFLFFNVDLKMRLLL